MNEDKIEVGEYVRTENGGIGRITRIAEGYRAKYATKFNNRIFYIARNNIVKHSKNIIDLIEKGDYVNGHKIIMDLEQSMKHYDTIDCFVTAKGYTFEEEDIKSIVTKEQFASVEYRVEED